jgi:hypothetical protein
LLAIVQQIAGNVPELQGDALQAKDNLHLAHPVLVPHWRRVIYIMDVVYRTSASTV